MKTPWIHVLLTVGMLASCDAQSPGGAGVKPTAAAQAALQVAPVAAAVAEVVPRRLERGLPPPNVREQNGHWYASRSSMIAAAAPGEKVSDAPIEPRMLPVFRMQPAPGEVERSEPIEPKLIVVERPMPAPGEVERAEPLIPAEIEQEPPLVPTGRGDIASPIFDPRPAQVDETPRHDTTSAHKRRVGRHRTK